MPGKQGLQSTARHHGAEVTASEAGRCCDEQEFRALGGLRVYKGAIWGRQIGNPGLDVIASLSAVLQEGDVVMKKQKKTVPEITQSRQFAESSRERRPRSTARRATTYAL